MVKIRVLLYILFYILFYFDRPMPCEEYKLQHKSLHREPESGFKVVKYDKNTHLICELS